jgi:aryl-alcohol dehydrogenase
MKITAAVAQSKDAPFEMQSLEIEDPRPNEVLVRVVGVGICHTDIKAWQQIRPVPLPVVLGHEGAGVVERIGSAVKKVAVGDHVVMTFLSCGSCRNCQDRRMAYCEHKVKLNFGARRMDDSSPLGEINAPFFGQSSFGTHALASERNVIPVTKDAPLLMLGPMGCGIQTGAGTVMNSLNAQAGASLVIFGAGSVGLSAVMAAHVVGCDPIIAVDVQPNRLELAEELGATHLIRADEVDPVEVVRGITAGGADFALDTSARPDVFRQAAESIRIMGECGLIGGMAPGQDVAIEANFLLMGRKLRGIVQGDSIPDEFIPHLIDLHMQGRFPFDKLITTYPFEDINTAVADMQSGKAIKPVLKVGAI